MDAGDGAISPGPLSEEGFPHHYNAHHPISLPPRSSPGAAHTFSGLGTKQLLSVSDTLPRGGGQRVGGWVKGIFQRGMDPPPSGVGVGFFWVLGREPWNSGALKITSQRLLDQSQAGIYMGKMPHTPPFGPFWAYSRTLPQGVELLV